jgi:ArsR family transcriptional regulator
MARTRVSQKRLLVLSKALADPLRLQILNLLLQEQEMSCGEVVHRFPVAQPTISHHLNILLRAGLVHMKKAGKHHIFWANREALQNLSEALQRLASRTPSGSTTKIRFLPKRKPHKKSRKEELS